MVGSIKGGTLVQKSEDNSYVPVFRREEKIEYLQKGDS
jgi:hypothetical protein